MKTKITIISLLFFIALSCNDSFLDLYPKDEQTEATAFVSYENFKTYAWGLYDIFPGYSDRDFIGDVNGGLFTMMSAGGQTPWSMGNVVVPSSGGDWDFSFIRRCNIMLDNIDNSSMSDVDKKHWRAVGLFFRSYRYIELLVKFGDVPWVENTLNEKSPELYLPRDSREVVASNILRDLTEAEQNIKSNGDGKNTINNIVVNALISRFGVFEGTWRKYHGLNEADKYLQVAVTAGEKVVSKIPNVNSNFDLLFNSEDLSNIEEVLLFKQYSAGLTGHALTRRVRTGEMQVEGTRYLVDSYLCTDGRPVSTSTVYEGSTNEYDNFRNRDRRLYLTVCPPFKTGDAFSGNITSWTRHSDPSFSEYIDLINNAAWKGGKSLPTSNFRTLYCTRMPNIASATNGVFNWGKTWMGYFVWRYYNTTTDVSNNNDVGTTDAPIFRVAEVMLNYAEASFELGQFTQQIADKTINKLRARGGVANMILADIDANWDTKRDTDVNPILWEIRRERVAELATEGFHFNDLRRWKKADVVLNKQPRGAFINKADYGNSTTTNLQDENGQTISGNNTEGYLWYFGVPSGWLSNYYLYPLPLNDLALNKQLEQNPGWSK
ncbi:RagB/SusD family nutrient uptake outer membrane protein [Petrimonas sp.]|uniref:RagB/SusD family nutrient uptake outer membrane protein n=1 Tax=Petrimonas sp. TaxID=2023866 RepID=UPI003F513E42